MSEENLILSTVENRFPAWEYNGIHGRTFIVYSIVLGNIHCLLYIDGFLPESWGLKSVWSCLIGVPVCYQPLKPSSITVSLCMKSFQENASSVPSAVWYNFSESDKYWQCPENYDLQTVLIVLCAFGNFRDFQFWDTSNTVLFCVCTIRMDHFHYGTGMVHLLSKSHPSANRRWCRSAMHSWRNARHIHEAAYTLASNCSISNDYCW